MEKITCTKCGKILESQKAVMLELNSVTGFYSTAGTVPESESQGGFWFGSDCAKQELKHLVAVGKVTNGGATEITASEELLGTRCIVYGGEALEIDGAKDATENEIPF